MFKNCVFKQNVNTVEWLKAAGIRALKTMAQTAVPLIPVGVSVTEIGWETVVGVSIAAGILSIITSVAGIPEVKKTETKEREEN